MSKTHRWRDVIEEAIEEVEAELRLLQRDWCPARRTLRDEGFELFERCRASYLEMQKTAKRYANLYGTTISYTPNGDGDGYDIYIHSRVADWAFDLRDAIAHDEYQASFATAEDATDEEDYDRKEAWREQHQEMNDLAWGAARSESTGWYYADD